MTKAAIDDAHAERMKTSAAKVEQFNAKLTEIGAAVAGKVLPQMEKWSPAILNAVDALGSLVSFAAENPIKAGVMYLGASIARAGVETVFRAGVEAMMKKAMGSSLGGGLAIGTAVLTITAATIAVMKYNEDKQKAYDKVANDQAGTNKLITEARKQAATGTIDKDLMNELARRGADIAGQRAAGRNYEDQDATDLGKLKHFLTKGASGITDYLGFTTGANKDLAENEGTGRGGKNFEAALATQAAAIDNLAGAIRTGRLKVDVKVNQPGPGGLPAVDDANRTGP
jgi:hypothetical protein